MCNYLHCALLTIQLIMKAEKLLYQPSSLVKWELFLSNTHCDDGATVISLCSSPPSVQGEFMPHSHFVKWPGLYLKSLSSLLAGCTRLCLFCWFMRWRNRFQKDTFGNCTLCSGLVFVNVNEVDVDYWVKMVAAAVEGVGVGGSIMRLSMPNKAFNQSSLKLYFLNGSNTTSFSYHHLDGWQQWGKTNKNILSSFTHPHIVPTLY